MSALSKKLNLYTVSIPLLWSFILCKTLVVKWSMQPPPPPCSPCYWFVASVVVVIASHYAVLKVMITLKITHFTGLAVTLSEGDLMNKSDLFYISNCYCDNVNAKVLCPQSILKIGGS